MKSVLSFASSFTYRHVAYETGRPVSSEWSASTIFSARSRPSREVDLNSFRNASMTADGWLIVERAIRWACSSWSAMNSGLDIWAGLFCQPMHSCQTRRPISSQSERNSSLGG